MLDIIAKTFLPPDGAAIVPVPTYGMYGVLTAQRPARVLPVPRLGAEARLRARSARLSSPAWPTLGSSG